VADIRRWVERFIEADPVIKKGLQRRIINSRALARYILEAKGVDSTLDTVLGIVRRYPLSAENDSRDRQVFKDCEIATRNNVADLAVENGPDIMRRIAEFASTIRSNRGESLRVTAGFRSIRVIADEKALESFRQTLRSKEIINYSNHLAEISLLFPPEAKSTKGIIAKISTELALNDVNLVGIICNSPEDILLVTEADAPRALQVLQRMLGEEAMNADAKRATSRAVLPN
jgi:hypothetical protein